MQVAHPPSDLSNGGSSQHVSGSQHLSGSLHLSGRASPFKRPQSAQKALKPTAFQDMLRRQLAQVPESGEQQEVAETSGGKEEFSSSMYPVPAELILPYEHSVEVQKVQVVWMNSLAVSTRHDLHGTT